MSRGLKIVASIAVPTRPTDVSGRPPGVELPGAKRRREDDAEFEALAGISRSVLYEQPLLPPGLQFRGLSGTSRSSGAVSPPSMPAIPKHAAAPLSAVKLSTQSALFSPALRNEVPKRVDEAKPITSASTSGPASVIKARPSTGIALRTADEAHGVVPPHVERLDSVGSEAQEGRHGRGRVKIVDLCDTSDSSDVEAVVPAHKPTMVGAGGQPVRPVARGRVGDDGLAHPRVDSVPEDEPGLGLRLPHPLLSKPSAAARPLPAAAPRQTSGRPARGTAKEPILIPDSDSDSETFGDSRARRKPAGFASDSRHAVSQFARQRSGGIKAPPDQSESAPSPAAAKLKTAGGSRESLAAEQERLFAKNAAEMASTKPAQNRNAPPSHVPIRRQSPLVSTSSLLPMPRALSKTFPSPFPSPGSPLYDATALPCPDLWTALEFAAAADASGPGASTSTSRAALLALALPASASSDPTLVRARFLGLARVLHPDRWSTVWRAACAVVPPAWAAILARDLRDSSSLQTRWTETDLQRAAQAAFSGAQAAYEKLNGHDG